MGCAASSSDDGAEWRRRGRALGHSEASTAGQQLAAGQVEQDPAASAARGRRSCKVAPEPNKEQQADPAPEHAMPGPGSPSFRHYCQKKEAAVERLVAEAEAVDRNGSIRITVAETYEAPKTNEPTPEDTSQTKIVEASKPKQVTKWLRFRGLAIVAAWYKLFSRHSGKKSFDASSSGGRREIPSSLP